MEKITRKFLLLSWHSETNQKKCFSLLYHKAHLQKKFPKFSPSLSGLGLDLKFLHPCRVYRGRTHIYIHAPRIVSTTIILQPRVDDCIGVRAEGRTRYFLLFLVRLGGKHFVMAPSKCCDLSQESDQIISVLSRLHD